MKHSEFKFKTFDGLQLFGQSWQPEDRPRAVICLVHGLGEHSGRYAHVADALNQAGYTLISFDLRGHGKSEGPRGHTPSYEALMKDISSLLEVANKQFPQLSSFLYGNSLGGNLVLNYVIRRQPKLKGAIVTSPWLRLAFEPPRFKIILAQITNYIWPSFSQKNGLDTKALSHDPEVVYAYENDSLIHDHISTKMFTGDDKIISVKASHEFANTKTKNCTFKIWDGLYHEIHNEPDKEKVFKFLIDWLDKKVLT